MTSEIYWTSLAWLEMKIRMRLLRHLSELSITNYQDDIYYLVASLNAAREGANKYPMCQKLKSLAI